MADTQRLIDTIDTGFDESRSSPLTLKKRAVRSGAFTPQHR
jgi:hypothetical protein